MLCLVTGATGFVGSAIARKLLAAGHDVRALVRPGNDRRNLDDLPVALAEGSLSDPASLLPAMRDVEALFHVAADYRFWVPDPAAMFRTNVDGTVALMTAALTAGVRRVVYTSSVATLGLNADGSPADETTPVQYDQMISPYKQSKFKAEAAVTRLVRDRGLPAVIVNPSTPIGPRDIKPTPTGKMIVDAASGRMPAYVDTGLNFAHVDDVADGHLLAFDRGVIGERYILGGENLTLAEMLARVCPLTGRSAPRLKLPADLILPVAYGAEWVARRLGTTPFVTVDEVKIAKKKMFFSSAKAEATLGYRPRPIDAAFYDAVSWFKAEGYIR